MRRSQLAQQPLHLFPGERLRQLRDVARRVAQPRRRRDGALRIGRVGEDDCRDGGHGHRVPLLLGLAVLAVEPLHAPFRIEHLFLARVERMTLGADFRLDLALGGAGLELVAAAAVHLGGFVRGVDPFLHRALLDVAAPGAKHPGVAAVPVFWEKRNVPLSHHRGQGPG